MKIVHIFKAKTFVTRYVRVTDEEAARLVNAKLGQYTKRAHWKRYVRDVDQVRLSDELNEIGERLGLS